MTCPTSVEKEAHTRDVTHFTTPRDAEPGSAAAAPVRRILVCRHDPACPSADAPDRDAAHTISTHPEQGWSLLCNGVVLFEDTGELLPNGQVIAPHRRIDAHPGSYGRLLV
jgi:hypothetical protein